MCCTYRGKRREKVGWRRMLLMIVAALAIGAVLLAGTLAQRSQADRLIGAGTTMGIAALAVGETVRPHGLA